MAKETDIKDAAAPPAAVDARDAEIKALTEKVIDLEKQLKAKGDKRKLPEGDFVVFGGLLYKITGNYRADNTFVEVKRGYCHEGSTLLSIERWT